MINIKDKSKCCGCHNCANSCPKNCITMKKDSEGFLYPVVDESKCINCNICENVCPIIKQYKFQKNFKPIVLGIYNKNKNIRKKSTSGGVFYELACYVISKNGVVFGAKYDDNLNVIHSYTETIEGVFDFMGSKYVQSNVSDNYKKVLEFLKEKRLVLFSGTPCQVAALKLFLKKDYENLICCDFVCEGVPSEKFLKSYIEHYENKYKSKVTKFEFRNKKNGWLNFSTCIYFENGKKKYIYRKFSILCNLLFSAISFRPSCYDCKYRELNSNSDFKLADFWKVTQSQKTKYNYFGVSHIVINSKKGKKIFDEIDENFEFFDSSYEEIKKLNETFSAYQIDIVKRNKLFSDISGKSNKEIYNIISKENKFSFIEKIKTNVRVILSDIKNITKR